MPTANSMALIVVAATLLLSGCLGATRHPAEQGPTAADGNLGSPPLPDPIHEERATTLVSHEHVGCDAFDNLAAPCVKYPFKLEREARITANITWDDPSEAMSLTVARGTARIAAATGAAGRTSLILVEDLEVLGDYDLWVQGRAAHTLDASFGEIPVMPPQTSSFEIGTPVRLDGVSSGDTLSLQEGCVAVSPDGKAVLAGFHGRFLEFSPGYASRDGGATWTRLSFPTAGVSGDCAVAMLKDGSWVFLGSTVVGATVLVSGDQGASWSVNALSAPPLAGGWADRPWLLGFDNEIWLAYMPSYGSPGSIAFTKSTDHGATWSIPRNIGEPLDGSTVQIGQFARDGSDVYLPFSHHPAFLATINAPATIELAHTKDGGDSWQVEKVHDGAKGDWPALAITESRHQALFFTDPNTRLMAMSREAGGVWSTPILLHGENGTSEWPFADGGKGANATWLVSEQSNAGERLWLGRFDAATNNETKWDIGEGSIEFASVDHDSAGNAFIVWSNQAERLFLKATIPPETER